MLMDIIFPGSVRLRILELPEEVILRVHPPSIENMCMSTNIVLLIWVTVKFNLNISNLIWVVMEFASNIVPNPRLGLELGLGLGLGLGLDLHLGLDLWLWLSL